MLYIITMAGQTVNANIEFANFSKNISICIFSRMLGMLSLLLIITSGLFLLLCYWLINASKYVERFIIQMTMNHDTTSIKNIFDNTIDTIAENMNEYTLWNMIPSEQIKKEANLFYKNRSKFEYLDCSSSSSSDSDSTEIDDENSISDRSDISTIPTYHEEIDYDKDTDTDNDNDNDNDNIPIKIKIEIETEIDKELDTDTDNNNHTIDNEIEDVTEQCIAEREEREREKQKYRDLIDLSSDSD